MNIRKLHTGDIEMAASINERREIRTLLSFADKNEFTMSSLESQFIYGYLDNPMGDGLSYVPVKPEDVVALTSAPLISDGENVYGYMDYQIHDFLRELVSGRPVKWTKG